MVMSITATQPDFPEITDAQAKTILKYLYRNGKFHAETITRESSTSDEYEDAKVHLVGLILGSFDAIESFKEGNLT